MRNDLMTEEVEIDPFIGRSAFAASKQITVERARFGEIAHGKRKMEAGLLYHRRMLCLAWASKAQAAVKGKPMRPKGQARKSARRVLAGRELLRIDGDSVPVTLRLNPRARRLIVKVHPSTGEVTVVAPSRRALDNALAFARSETDWIKKRLARVPKPVPLGFGERIPYRGELHQIVEGEKGRAPAWIDEEDGEPVILVSGHPQHAERRVLDFLKREARRVLDERVMHHAAKIGIKPRRITVRDTASRWGSCSAARSLSFSWRLILAPDYVLDYVVAHEMAHLKEMNHGPRFWKLVDLLVDDVRRAQRWLSEHGTVLHRYAPRVIGN